eukprot:CAMPEP_0197941136 /NCGR_PEP_ID=MMETSP1439-20131203/122324_1 /TAXON_ID=66791 /ORGANISM="Gonyaulax spinifera, Strain CCMP409" /LENGTH=268 /DNA_ID=CAMNT_0043564323 /DNA_START=126 /DNA_END=930 /DNA_ORIENTATION=+
MAATCLLPLAAPAVAERLAPAGALGQDGGAAMTQNWSVLLGGGARLLDGLFGAMDDGPPGSDKGATFRAGTLALAIAVASGLRYHRPQTDEDNGSTDTPGSAESCGERAVGPEDGILIHAGAAEPPVCREGLACPVRADAAEPPACKDDLACEYEEFMDGVYEDLLAGLDDGQLCLAPIDANECHDELEVDEPPRDSAVRMDSTAVDSEVECSVVERNAHEEALEEALSQEWREAQDMDYGDYMEQEYRDLLGRFLETGEVLETDAFH